MNAVRKKLAAGTGAEVVHWIDIRANALLARGDTPNSSSGARLTMK